jgi:hypothetical protein
VIACDDDAACVGTAGYCEDEEVSAPGTVMFNCSALGYDRADCLTDPTTGCFTGHAPDCAGQCAPVFVTAGDGECDAEWEGFFLNCSATGWDGGDCMP